MGLKNFLKQQGFITEESEDKTKRQNADPAAAQKSAQVAPMFFPVQPPPNSTVAPSPAETGDPSFVSPLPQSTSAQSAPDPTFVKFFEDELVKANLPGPDYFEFREQLMKTQQKMAAKGINATDVILQAVIMNFETQDVSPAKLIEAAKHYKDVLKQKNDDFLKGASAEKNNQLQKRQNVLQSHNDAIKKIQDQLKQLELQKQQLDQTLNREQTQMEVDKSLGKEGIEKIEKAEQMIALAHTYIQSTIDADIKRLQSAV